MPELRLGTCESQNGLTKSGVSLPVTDGCRGSNLPINQRITSKIITSSCQTGIQFLDTDTLYGTASYSLESGRSGYIYVNSATANRGLCSGR